MAAVVDREQVGRAVDALLKWKSSKRPDHISLLADEQTFQLVLALRRIPDKGRVNPFCINLPHPFRGDGEQVCLIVNDLPGKGIPRKEAKQRVLQEGLNISKVLGLTKLKTDYSTYEARRKLCGSYDLFLTDKSAVKRLPKLIGKAFFKLKKHPIPINLTKSSWKKQLDKVQNSTFLYITPGSCSVMKVAKLSQPRDDVVENVMACISSAAELIPRKWKNVMALHLRLPDSPALPIYQATPEVVMKIGQLPAPQVVKVSLNHKQDDEQTSSGDAKEDRQQQQQPSSSKKTLSKQSTKTRIGSTTKVLKKVKHKTKSSKA